MLASFPYKVPKTQRPKARKSTFSITSLLFDAPLQETPSNIHKNFILPEFRVIRVFVADTMGLYSFVFSWWAPKDACVLKQSA